MSIKGWVYIITNRAMPGLVKVGYSMKDPALRAAELNHTGNPHPYDVQYECLVVNPRDVEQATHGRLSSHREGKEWFRCDIASATQQIRVVAGDSIFLENTLSGQGSLLDQAKARIQELEEQIAQSLAPEYRFIEAINSEDIEWRKCAARYPKWPKELLLEFYENEAHSEVLAALAANPGLPSENIADLVLEMLDDDVAEAAVRNPSTSADTLAEIAWLSDFSLLQVAKNHPNFTVGALNKILAEKSIDESYQVRSWVAEFEECPIELLVKLAGDASDSVRLAVAKNPNTPLDQIYLLVSDIDVGVSDAASNNPSHPARLSARGELMRIFDLLENPLTPIEALLDMERHSNYQIRQAVALNPKCPQGILDRLSTDTEIRVRIAAKRRVKAA